MTMIFVTRKFFGIIFASIFFRYKFFYEYYKKLLGLYKQIDIVTLNNNATPFMSKLMYTM